MESANDMAPHPTSHITAIELCAGVGMLGVGAAAALRFLGTGLRTVCYVEREAAAAAQLVALIEARALDAAPVWSDLLTFDGAAWRGCVDWLIAGFPCQDISIAGRRAGLDGQRSGLFFRILDIAADCGARGLFLENVSAISTATATAVDETEGALDERAAARVVGELAERGWNSEWLTLSASDVGANHGRERWFCFAWRVGHAGLQHQHLQQWPHGTEPSGTNRGLADAENADRRCEQKPQDQECGGAGSTGGREELAHATGDGRHQGRPEPIGQQGRPDASECGGTVADTSQPGLEGRELANPRYDNRQWQQTHGSAPELRGAPLFAPGPADPRWAEIITNRPDLAPATEPGVRLLVDGMAHLVDESRAHQLRQIGNGVVPLQAAAALVELIRRAQKL
jgi:DNA (cytosine-5)-methyltransferase 1